MPLLSFSGTAFLATLFLSVAAMPTSKAVEGVSLVLSLEVPSSVDDVDDFTVTGTLESTGTKDIKVVTDPDGILFKHFPPDVFDFKKESYETLKKSGNITKVDLEERTMPMFVGGAAKWSINTYLINHPRKAASDSDTTNKGSKSGSKDGNSPGSSDYTSDEDTNSSQPSEADSSKTSTGSSQGEGKTYPPHTTQDLPAGQSMDFTYDVGEGYDFTRSGAGVYNVKLSRDFFWVLVDDVLTRVKVDVKSSKVTIKEKFSGDPPQQRRNVKTRKRDAEKLAGPSSLKTRSCDDHDISIIEKATTAANQLVKLSKEALEAMKSDDSNRNPYEKWFGKWNTEPNLFQTYRPRDHVQAMYKGIRSFDLGGDKGGYTYDCDCDQNIMAWVTIRKNNDLPEEPIINLCVGFFSDLFKISGGYDTKAGTLIHEATHFPYVRPRSRDIARNVGPARELSLKPFDAVVNADSYEYFAEERYSKPAVEI